MVTYGTGLAGCPYYRFGAGEESLVVIPGLFDSLGWNTPSWLPARLLAHYYFRPYSGFDVWQLSRAPGLPRDVSVYEMAQTYHEALQSIGDAHVIGISLGGYIGSTLATISDHVQSLVLVGCGREPGQYGRQTIERWRGLAASREYAALHRDYVRTVYAGYRRILMPPLYRVAAPVLPRPAVEGDVERSCAATLSFDGEDVFADISVPTLVVGGTEDVLYPLDEQQALVEDIDGATHATFDGGHAVIEERRTAVANRVTSFLS